MEILTILPASVNKVLCRGASRISRQKVVEEQRGFCWSALIDRVRVGSCASEISGAEPARVWLARLVLVAWDCGVTAFPRAHWLSSNPHDHAFTCVQLQPLRQATRSCPRYQDHHCAALHHSRPVLLQWLCLFVECCCRAAVESTSIRAQTRTDVQSTPEWSQELPHVQRLPASNTILSLLTSPASQLKLNRSDLAIYYSLLCSVCMYAHRNYSFVLQQFPRRAWELYDIAIQHVGCASTFSPLSRNNPPKKQATRGIGLPVKPTSRVH